MHPRNKQLQKALQNCKSLRPSPLGRAEVTVFLNVYSPFDVVNICQQKQCFQFAICLYTGRLLWGLYGFCVPSHLQTFGRLFTWLLILIMTSLFTNDISKVRLKAFLAQVLYSILLCRLAYQGEQWVNPCLLIHAFHQPPVPVWAGSCCSSGCF